jgi:hypothetical protein
LKWRPTKSKKNTLPRKLGLQKNSTGGWFFYLFISDASSFPRMPGFAKKIIEKYMYRRWTYPR